MANMSCTTLLSEAEFGCEHLAAVFTKDQDAAGRFKASFMRTNHELAPRGSLAGDASKKNSTAGFLKPKYTCLGCSGSFVNGDRKAHMEKTGHMFYMESRNRILFCQGCCDFIYDHSLDRLRSSAPKDMVKGRNKRLLKEYSPDDEVYIRSNAAKRPCARQGVRGLFNLGQTCYMNSIVQTLLHDPLFNNYFLGNGHDHLDGSPFECLGCAFTEVVADFNNYEKPEGFPALAVLLASWKQIPSMAGYYQHDAHEWYQFLIDKLHACTEGHVEDAVRGCPCFFHKTFYGKLRSSVTCDKCGNVNRTDEPMIDLSLDVQIQAKKRAMGGSSSSPPTLNGCLESFTSPEKLMADAYNCTGCGGTPQKATKQMQIKKLPTILCMQLKRFEHKPKASSKTSFSDKIEGRIDFPLSVNMLPYTTNPNSQRVDRSKYWYDLSSAVVHKGKLESGHYYTYCRQGNQWFLFNDDQVTSVSEAEVLNADAYLLFYHLRTLSYTSY